MAEVIAEVDCGDEQGSQGGAPEAVPERPEIPLTRKALCQPLGDALRHKFDYCHENA
jgi:hypothetical protein